tara:strand:- start:12 stop:683 length:672 start_codon:yes stop_codon:yes gene_type:complete
MKKETQKEINDRAIESFENLIEANKFAQKSRDIMMKLLTFEGHRIDTLENKIDLLMIGRGISYSNVAIDPSKVIESKPVMKNEAKCANTYYWSKEYRDGLLDDSVEDDVWYNEESKKASLENLNATNKSLESSIEDHLDKERSDTKITPQALVDLGFKEVYQGIDQGDAGFLYYDLEIKGVGLLSTSLGEDEPLHVMLGYEGQHPIHNLVKLKELIRILTLID